MCVRGGTLPKNQTLFIQEAIYELGRKLGLISAIEHTSMPSSECYAPKYDVVWYGILIQRNTIILML